MAKRSAEFAEVIEQVRRTPGWKVKETREGGQIYSPDSSKPVTAFHRNAGSSDRNTFQVFKQQLKKAGWSSDLAEEAKQAERDQRMALAEPMFSDLPPAPEHPSEPDAPEPYAEFMDVTPELAQEWLDRDAKRREELGLPLANRNLRRDFVRAWAQDMASHRWLRTHEAVAIDTNECIPDGQHRLNALIEAGVTLKLLVAFNVSPDVMLVCDTGIRRTAGDALRMRKVPDANRIAAALRLLALYDYVPVAAWRRTRFGPHLVVEMLDRHPGIIDANKRSARVGSAGILRSAATVGIYVAQREWPQGKDKLREFLLGVGEGMNLSSGDPRLRLRNFALDARMPQRRRENDEHLALLIECWNKFAADEKMGRLSLGRPDKMPRPFTP